MRRRESVRAVKASRGAGVCAEALSQAAGGRKEGGQITAGRGQARARAGEAGTGLGLRRRGERAGEDGGERSAGT